MSEIEAAREHLALLEACEPIQTVADAAKDAYRAAVAGDDAVAVAVACQAHEAAANTLHDTRKWLRTEARLARRAEQIAELEGKPLNDEQRGLLAAYRAEVPILEEIAQPYREAMAALGVEPADPGGADRGGPGDAVVEVPAVAVKARPRRMGA